MASGKYKPKGVWGKRVSWCCQHCGMKKQVRPSEAKRRYCGKACYAQSVRHQRDSLFCRHCGSSFWRPKKDRDSRYYCSKSCAGKASAKHSAHVTAWMDYLACKERRIGLEVRALRAIARRTANVTRKCAECNDTFIKLKPYSRYCSVKCHEAHKSRSLLRYKTSESYRATKRKAKAKRRAISKSAIADAIDPIDVFERDGWRCHLCGKKTMQSKRGTSHHLAPELEHIVSLADGGRHTWENVACSCRSCNCKKGAQSFGQLLLGIPA